MTRTFDIPPFYRSEIVSQIKRVRREGDTRKKDLSPTVLSAGRLTVKLARHFGFCFGVENAIEIAYRALKEHPEARIFLLSEMIHNPHVNEDLLSRGVKFLFSTTGEVLIPLSELTNRDIVIIPAFGTTKEMFANIRERGIDPLQYNTTCPFVEKVWRRSQQLGGDRFAVVIHGKPSHEETKATFSHAAAGAPSIVVYNREETEHLCRYIRGESTWEEVAPYFVGRFSEDFNPERDLHRLGVVNQTTMLASETQEISAMICAALTARHGSQAIGEHFADTRDTLCYATNENQDSVLALLKEHGDFALVVGGYNSSNTSHLVELLETHCPTYYIKDSAELVSGEKIRHKVLATGQIAESTGWLVAAPKPVTVLITAGASCPDALVDQVIQRLAALSGCEEALTQALSAFKL